MVERVARVKWFLGSTTERIQEAMDKFMVNLCPGNFIDLRLWKHGDVYQAALVYAEVVPAEVNRKVPIGSACASGFSVTRPW